MNTNLKTMINMGGMLFQPSLGVEGFKTTRPQSPEVVAIRSEKYGIHRFSIKRSREEGFNIEVLYEEGAVDNIWTPNLEEAIEEAEELISRIVQEAG